MDSEKKNKKIIHRGVGAALPWGRRENGAVTLEGQTGVLQGTGGVLFLDLVGGYTSASFIIVH